MTNNILTTTPTSPTWLPIGLDSERSIDLLCREWHLLQARVNYEGKALHENDEKTFNAFCDAVMRRQEEIMLELAERDTTDPKELGDILYVAYHAMEGGHLTSELDRELVEAVRQGLIKIADITRGIRRPA